MGGIEANISEIASAPRWERFLKLDAYSLDHCDFQDCAVLVHSLLLLATSVDLLNLS